MLVFYQEISDHPIIFNRFKILTPLAFVWVGGLRRYARKDLNAKEIVGFIFNYYKLWSSNAENIDFQTHMKHHMKHV